MSGQHILFQSCSLDTKSHHRHIFCRCHRDMLFPLPSYLNTAAVTVNTTAVILYLWWSWWSYNVTAVVLIPYNCGDDTIWQRQWYNMTAAVIQCDCGGIICDCGGDNSDGDILWWQQWWYNMWRWWWYYLTPAMLIPYDGGGDTIWWRWGWLWWRHWISRCHIPVVIVSLPLSYCFAVVTLLLLYCPFSNIILYIMSYTATATAMTIIRWHGPTGAAQMNSNIWSWADWCGTDIYH